MSRARDERLSRLIRELDLVVERALEFEDTYSAQLELLHPQQVPGGLNLLHYLALRGVDLRDLQYELASLGLSSLGRSESHVLASVCAVRNAARHLMGVDARCPRPPVSLRQGRSRIRRQTNALFGRKLKGSHVRIMVTMPMEAADDYSLVLDMLRAGMNCARINCAHGDPHEWERTVANVHRARQATGRTCRIFMDLCGPKIRTGALTPGPEVIRLGPKVDDRGVADDPEVLYFVPEGADMDLPKGHRIPVAREFLAEMRPKDVVEFVDTRGLPVSLSIRSVRGGVARASCWTHGYVESGLRITLRDKHGEIRTESVVGRLPEIRPKLRLRVGDRVVVHKDAQPGENARVDDRGRLVAPAHVPCAVPEVLDRIEVGHEIVLDDGKIRAVAVESRRNEIVAEVTHAGPGGANLRAFKGINLPDTRVGLFGLTEKDLRDLPFVVEHADGVNVSFVNHPDDVADLFDELEAAGGAHLGLVLKIETLMGVRHLPGIILTALEWPAVGVMVARGDLAAEVGWTRLARAAEEILWLCEAAHVPVVWATEVLNNLAKKGIPTRGEISDVVLAGRTECVMLNKGPFITTAIRTLDTILSSTEEYQAKRTALLPTLMLETPDPGEIGRTVGGREGRWIRA